MATKSKAAKKTSSTQDATPAAPVTLNEALVSEYPDDFVVQYVFAPAAKTPRRMLRYITPIRTVSIVAGRNVNATIDPYLRLARLSLCLARSVTGRTRRRCAALEQTTFSMLLRLYSSLQRPTAGTCGRRWSKRHGYLQRQRHKPRDLRKPMHLRMAQH